MDGSGLRAERVVAPSGRVGWTVVDAVGVAVAPAEAFLRYRFDCEASPNTLRAYAHDLKLFFGFLAERSLGWRELSPAELGEFVAWLRRPAGNGLLLPGTPPARAASTVNRALSAVMSFYDFHRLHGIELADLMLDPRRSGRGGFRPFLAGIARDSARGRRGRMPVARRAPRVLSLEQVARVVAAQSRLRDRLLFVLLFTTGMRIGQALGLRHDDVRLWKRELAIVPREDNANGARGKRGSAVVPLTEEAARLYLLYMERATAARTRPGGRARTEAARAPADTSDDAQQRDQEKRNDPAAPPAPERTRRAAPASGRSRRSWPNRTRTCEGAFRRTGTRPPKQGLRIRPTSGYSSGTHLCGLLTEPQWLRSRTEDRAATRSFSFRRR